ncbi:tRNA threonylcarbamoyladenosine biosynthesis protein TsaB [Geothermobacter ehrlichii]|uniref:tRNA threonylcarbamoyladenosine biosynthesis protein TsaB n=1 Tax=Geothermobacter ehrlichii TaxID=213224 RepID=A0A5D3WKK6_9BACT|nr:tRNA (adenosine(37)-N6)-threonylcarbamoyltransferase complex dimerization subunit type 1 TsaB [Geothermobacter ehrlichii]TYO99534.1 tRNA threonylcarbamoyladenosine biosynthesis protein TsaB [Geothermobacter ehrlichii]
MGGRVLVVDTSTPAGSVALCEDGRVLAEYFRRLPGTHTDWLLAAVDRLLADAGTTLGELSLLAVVQGPGSFTGLRVGIATVKGLAMAAGLPVIGLSSLELLAAAVPFARMPVCALLDARKKEVYAALFDTANGLPVPLGVERVLPPERLAGELDGDILFVGEGAEVYRAFLAKRLGARAHFAGAAFQLPRASFGGRLALAKEAAGEAVSAAVLRPVYIRSSEAELARKGGVAC